MKKIYETTFNVMCQGDESLAKIMEKFVSDFPTKLKDKLSTSASSATVNKDGKTWEFTDNGKEFCISLGKSSNSYKDFMSMYLMKITDSDLKNRSTFLGDKMIGYLTLYLYPKDNQKGKPLAVTYAYYAKRVDGKLVMKIDTNVNASFEDNRVILDNYGLSYIHQNVVDGYYVIDIEKAIARPSRI